RIAYEALPEDDPKVRRPDIARAKSLLNWTPEIPLEEGLRRTVAYFKSKFAGAK
ncbi:MAG: UDP-glucuronate decarboxylase, partial [Acidobacteria bacterium]|nr:UDP-glucuronate decarboxylase [Acidobacteriota bacterium]